MKYIVCLFFVFLYFKSQAQHEQPVVATVLRDSIAHEISIKFSISPIKSDSLIQVLETFNSKIRKLGQNSNLSNEQRKAALSQYMFERNNQLLSIIPDKQLSILLTIYNRRKNKININ